MFPAQICICVYNDNKNIMINITPTKISNSDAIIKDYYIINNDNANGKWTLAIRILSLMINGYTWQVVS